MKFRNKSGHRRLQRVLSLAMAVMTCFLLAVEAVATEDQSAKTPAVEITSDAETGKITVVVGREQQNTQADEQLEAETATEQTDTEAAADENAAEEPVPEETQPAIPAATEEEFLAAWAELMAVMDEESLAQYAEAIKAVEDGVANYTRQDAVLAVKNCAQALTFRQALQADVDQILAKVDAAADLPAEERETYRKHFVDEMTRLSFDSVQELLAALTAITPETEIVTPETDKYLETMTALQMVARNLSILLDNAALWDQIESRLTAIGGYALPEASMARYQDLLQRFEALKNGNQAYLTLTGEEQTALVAELQALAKEAIAFHETLALENADMLTRLQTRIASLEETVSRLSGKLLFAYIGLGVAALALIMAIVAAVFALRKPKDETIDVSKLASRSAAETLDTQHRILKDRLDMLEGKLDAMTERQEKKPEPKAEPKKESKPKAELKSKPEPKVEPDPLPREICRLRLNYQSSNTANSFLSVDDAGKYVLYADNTVALAAGELGSVNEMKGWQNDGLLFLFNPKIGGTVLDADREMLPAGYYEITETVVRAQVVSNGDKRYNLRQKGVIAMKR